MTETIQTQLDALRDLRLPDLQARFAEIVGEETRCPNIVASIDDIPGDISGGGGTGGVLVVNGEVYNFNEWVTEITLSRCPQGKIVALNYADEIKALKAMTRV